MYRRPFKELCTTFELALADSAAEGTAKCLVLKGIDRAWEYKWKRTDLVLGFAISLDKVLLSEKMNQGK